MTKKKPKRAPTSSTAVSKPISQRITPRTPYAVPKQKGGELIRHLVKKFRSLVPRPQSGSSSGVNYILSVSGGLDSMALAHCLLKYGRNVASPDRFLIVHFSHGWRPEKAKREKTLVETLARKYGARFLHVESQAPVKGQKGESPEDAARKWRHKIYNQLRQTHDVPIVLAHHLDDQAETVFWRVMTGNFGALGGMPLYDRDQNLFRPLLEIEKNDLLAFAKEERIRFSRDETNLNTRYLRGALRTNILPRVQTQFPQYRRHLSALAASFRGDENAVMGADSGLNSAPNLLPNSPPNSRPNSPANFLAGLGLRLKQQSVIRVQEWMSAVRTQDEIFLPDGWKLKLIRKEGNEIWEFEKKRLPHSEKIV